MNLLCMTFLTLMKLNQSPAGASPLHIPAASPQPPAELSGADQKFAKEYLHHFYGYQPEPDRRKRATASRDESHQTTGFCDKVKKMQRFFGLTPDGKLSQETLTVMKKPRCGLSDVEPHGGAVRWTKRTISYRIAGENLPFPASRTLKAIRTALKLWSSVSLVRFRRREAKEADVSIAFVSGDHGDGSPFSGKGGALAHAFLPGLGLGGDVHFDSAEEWTLNSTGISLPVVAAHEFGHALGLSHSPDPGSIMYPAYNFAPSLELSFHDVKSIQHLYGENPNFHLQSLKRPPPKTPDKCDPDLSFDAVTELQQEVVFFKDRFMWRKHPSFVETRISLISSLWSDSIPSHLDAVYENAEKNFILFFKGDQYWKVQQLILQEGFPRNISDLGFPSRIKSVDAALHFRDDRYTVFFTGHECWRYNELRAMMEGSPMLIEQQWLEIPFPVDAAVYYEGFVNFFKGNKQYKYDFGQNHVVSVSSANDLMDCEMGKSNKHALFLWRVFPQSYTPQQILITNFWPNAPDSVDAAYESQQSDGVFFFKGREVWAFSGYDLVQDYPKSISSFSLPKDIKKVDAALNDPETGKTLFFVGSDYYSYDETTKTMDSGFPKRVDGTFSGMTTKVTAALQYRGYTYLYSGPYMYEFSLRTGRMLRLLRNSYFLPCTNY